MSEKPTVNDMMVAYAQDAVDMAKANFGETLDYSESSVKTVEACLAKMHDAIPKGFFGKLFRRGPSADVILTVSKMFGGYVGEVFRKHHGGEWLLAPAPGSDAPVITLQHSGVGSFWPPGKVHKRIVNGPDDNVWFYYRVLTSEQIKK